MGKTKEETQSLLEEHNSFKEKAKETREKVKLLLVLADTLMEKGHAHAMQIKSWVEEVNYFFWICIFLSKIYKTSLKYFQPSKRSSSFPILKIKIVSDNFIR